jgi:phosphoenolpyruvate carboxykinase (GTP)
MNGAQMNVENVRQLLKEKLDARDLEKLDALDNKEIDNFVAQAIQLCTPEKVFVCTDSDEDIRWVREQTIAIGEEKKLTMEGHTYHFDGYNDQARDKANTRYMVSKDMPLGANLNTIDKEEALGEVRGYLNGIMKGKTMIVRFFCLGPTNSKFSITGIQLTDSFYVAHSEDLLYRPGYEQSKKLKEGDDFFKVLHSAGELVNGCSKNTDKRRIYFDLEDNTVYSTNTQYAGNTVGFKKLCLRLAIRKADREGWLAEHMFILGVNGNNKRKTYFAGAFPSACGKTSTAMLPGENVIGDDIAYLREIDGEARTVNVESGIFGIIRDVNPDDDPVIYNVLNTPGEVIFSNILINDGKPNWLGMGRELPTEGVNHSGQWQKGATDDKGNNIDPSHKNARYTVKLGSLDNLDENANNPDGVPVSGIIYGGRDSDTCVPVQQAYSWEEGVVMGASLESETTAATLGKEGVRTFQPMSNLDFVSISLGRYIQNYIDFGKKLKKTPPIFGVNYFLKNEQGQYLNGMLDKKVWMKWAELVVHSDVEAIDMPTGRIPKYEDLARLFKELLDQEYTLAQYEEQFTIRIPEIKAKLDRIEEIYRTKVSDTPEFVFNVMDQQRKKLDRLQQSHGDHVSPSKL